MRHGVEPEEAEDALLDPRRVVRGAYNVAGEKRSAVVGAAGSGRLLFVVFVRRGDLIRVVSARDAVESEKRAYRRRRK
jgi:uncharacterized DUF497 family protein